MLTQAILKDLLHYNPETGVFTWIKKSAKGMKFGSIAGSDAGRGYSQISINKKRYSTHRLAWLYIYGEFPKDCIDHKDGNPANNAIDNLRDATKSQNQFNTTIKKNSKSGFKGVERKENRFLARARINGIVYYLGCYKTGKDASSAYQEFTKEKHGEFYRV